MLGVDLSFAVVTRDIAHSLYSIGYRVAIQDLWTGGYANHNSLLAVGETNLQAFIDEGFLVLGYCNSSPWYESSISIAEAKRVAGSTWNYLLGVANDVEIDELNVGHVREHQRVLTNESPLVPIYTRRNFWIEKMDNAEEFSQYPLWNAYYDSDQDIDYFSNPYGGWMPDKLFGEQYMGSTTLVGIEIDLNVFTDSFFHVEQPIPPTTIEQRLELIEYLLRKSGIEMASMSDINLLEAIRGSQVAIKALIQSSQLPPEIVKEWLGDSK